MFSSFPRAIGAASARFSTSASAQLHPKTAEPIISSKGMCLAAASGTAALGLGFWKWSKPEAPSMITFKCLPNAEGPYKAFSNYYPSPFKYVVPIGSEKGTEIFCEHGNTALHCTKASFFEDKANFEEIKAESDPGKCQQLGRKCRNFSDAKWLPVVEDVAFEMVRQKFASDPLLKQLLLSTGDAQIVNVNNNPLWGIGKDSEGNNFTITEADLKGNWSEKWPGQNVQGKALMRAREWFAAESKK